MCIWVCSSVCVFELCGTLCAFEGACVIFWCGSVLVFDVSSCDRFIVPPYVHLGMLFCVLCGESAYCGVDLCVSQGACF